MRKGQEKQGAIPSLVIASPEKLFLSKPVSSGHTQFDSQQWFSNRRWGLGGFFGINLIVTYIYFTSICSAGQGQTKPKLEGVAKCEGLASSSSWDSLAIWHEQE